MCFISQTIIFLLCLSFTGGQLDNDTTEAKLNAARHGTRAAKVAYEDAVANRSDAQRGVNALLERKHSWNDADVSTFTTLVRVDHSSSAAVASTSANLQTQELALDRSFSDLTNAILRRYHEEQVWSDKIRSVATWANLIGLAVNFFIFVGAVAIVEPWKRRRLVARVEERMTSLMEQLQFEIKNIEQRLEGSAPVPPSLLTTESDQYPSPTITEPSPATAKHIVGETTIEQWPLSFINRITTLSLSSETIVGLCGIVGGAMLGIALSALRHS